jgi:thioredoxin-related protein
MKALLRIFLFLVVSSFVCSAASKPGWTEDYDKALTEAKASGKLLLLDFTGSDWCPWCVRMDKEVFSKPKFKDWAKQNLVLVELDFPHSKFQSKKVQAQNEKLQKQFQVSGFPTMVLLGSDGKPRKVFGGYQEGGADAFVEELSKVTGK